MAAPWEQQYETETTVSKKPAKSVPPPAVAEAPAPAASEADISTQFGNEFEREKARIKAAQVQSAQQMQTDTPLLNSALLTSPPALMAYGAAALYAGSKVLPVVNAIKNRYLSSSPQNLSTLDTRVEPPMGTPAAPSTVLSLDEARARMAGVTSEPVLSDSLLPRAAPVFTDPVLGTPEIDRNIPAYQRQGITFAGTTPIGQPAVTAPTPLAPAITPAEVAPVTYVQPGQSFATTPNEFVGPPAPIRPNPEEFVGPMRPVAPPPEEFIGPPRPVIPTAGPNSTATKAVADTVTDLIKTEGAVKTGTRGPAPGTSTKIQLTPEQLGMKMPIGFGTGDTWLYNTLGPEKYQAFVQEVNQGKPFGNQYNLAQKAYQETYLGPKLPPKIAMQREIPRPAANFGGVAPELVSVGPPTKEALQNLQPAKATSSQKGGATIGGLANVGLNALGIAGLMSDFKEAKKTGDYSNFGLNATGQAIANFIPKLAIPFQLASYSKQLGESPEDLKALGKKLQDAQQAARVGAGRGIGVPPPR
tara:strand:- start:31 stop:1620 length:1590 start_codon:yes stop_codon:yes gene_type:complete